MFGFLKKSPEKQLQNEHKELVSRAFQAQRDGNIRLYSTLTAEAEAVLAKLQQLQSENAA